MWQTFAYWLMGAVSNDASKLAYLTGFCKSFIWFLILRCTNKIFTDKAMQSAGAAGVWRADGVGVPYVYLYLRKRTSIFWHEQDLLRFMNIFISTWVLLVAGLICALPMMYTRIKDHTTEEDDDLYAYHALVPYTVWLTILIAGRAPSPSSLESPHKCIGLSFECFFLWTLLIFGTFNSCLHVSACRRSDSCLSIHDFTKKYYYIEILWSDWDRDVCQPLKRHILSLLHGR